MRYSLNLWSLVLEDLLLEVDKLVLKIDTLGFNIADENGLSIGRSATKKKK